MKPVDVVREWVDAVNAQRVLGVMARSARDIAMHGPRGTARGQPALREWIERSGLHMTVERTFAQGAHVVVLHHATWRDGSGLTVAEATVANHFVVSGDRVQSVARFDALADALADAGLSDAHDVEARLADSR
jgi:hypothetical protein